jgi:hypothetical protein
MTIDFPLADHTFYKFNPIDEHRVQIVLWDYRFPKPLQMGMIMNLEDDDFDAASLEYALTALAVNMANYVMTMASYN